MKLLWVIGAAALLAGCAHNITLTPADGVGSIGRGTAQGTLVASSAKMAVALEGKAYDGMYVYQSGGGTVGFGSGFAGGQFATANFVGMSTTGGGRAYLTEPGGESLSCAFSYSEMSGSGTGQCRTSAGKLYDLLIH